MSSPRRILFILKRSSEYGYSYGYNASGLRNSAEFVVEMLRAGGIDAKLVIVTDNNDIDREVTEFRPSIVVIEALWVVPSKFAELVPLHPGVKWIVRVHSDWPFLAQEGMAVEWIIDYLRHKHVYVAFNSLRIAEDVLALHPRHRDKVLYLPNYYPIREHVPMHTNSDVLKIGSFGAIRPLKNQLIQAVAAIEYANRQEKKLEYHINGTRSEGGDEVLKNIRALFNLTHHKLVEHKWMTHPEFLDLLATMDFCLAVSFSETFCIVAADSAAVGTPLICSDQIPWATSLSIVPPTHVSSIVRRMERVHGSFKTALIEGNRQSLHAYSRLSRAVWLHTLHLLN